MRLRTPTVAGGLLPKTTYLVMGLFLACTGIDREEVRIDAEIPDSPSESAISRWNDQKYSMFIHFGPYSEAGGVWNGQRVTRGYSEQIRAHGKIPRDAYRQLAAQFNPTNWDPDSVAALAKRAGMKSIVITAKHHDGFALFDTEFSDFDIVDATPYGKDIIQGLAEACLREGMKFGVYYSLIDWDFPGAVPISDHNSDSIPPAHHQLNLDQIKELMTGYGPISEIWFDMGKPTRRQSEEYAELVRKYQRNCLVSGRIWNDQGDFAVMGDNASPDFQMGALWQTPASVFDETWGYRSWQERTDPAAKVREKLDALIRTVSQGGNYLLNIGPRGDGSIVEYERDVLLGIGNWLALNGDAIYGSRPSPLREPEWGYLTQKPGQLFAIVPGAVADSTYEIKGMLSHAIYATVPGIPDLEVPITKTDDGIAFAFTKEILEQLRSRVAAESRATQSYLPDSVVLTPTVPVLDIKFARALKYLPENLARADASGEMVLDTANSVAYHSYSGADYYSTRPTVIRREWHVDPLPEATQNLLLRYPAADIGKGILLDVNGEEEKIILDDESGTDQSGRYYRRISVDGWHTEDYNRISLSRSDLDNDHADMELEGLELLFIQPGF